MLLTALQRNLPLRSRWAVAYCCSPLVRLHGCVFVVLTDTLRPGLAVLAHIGADEDIMKLGAKVRHLDGRTVDGRCVFDLNYDILEKRAHGLGVHRAALFKGKCSASSAAFSTMNIFMFTMDCTPLPLTLRNPPPPPPPSTFLPLSQFSLTMLQLPAPASTHHSMSPPQPNTQTTPSASAPCPVKATGPSIWWWTAAEGTADWSTQPPKMLRKMSRIRTRRCGGCANRHHNLARNHQTPRHRCVMTRTNLLGKTSCSSATMTLSSWYSSPFCGLLLHTSNVTVNPTTRRVSGGRNANWPCARPVNATHCILLVAPCASSRQFP
jgi:hypothetical protein